MHREQNYIILTNLPHPLEQSKSGLWVRVSPHLLKCECFLAVPRVGALEL